MTDQWRSAWKPAFDAIVELGPKTYEAVGVMLDHGDKLRIKTPHFYVSTAISSAGWRRHPDLRDSEKIPEAIIRNNRTTALVLDNLVTNTASFVTGETMMVPTDLGKVPSWKDTDYLIFYFAWLAGLNAVGAERFAKSFDEDQYQHILRSTNNRDLTNDQRWPWYQLFTEVALTKLRYTESLPNTHAGSEAHILLQVIDVEESLGCRAERLFADSRGLDILIPTFGEHLPGDLLADVTDLRKLGASVGAVRNEMELVPVSLR